MDLPFFLLVTTPHGLTDYPLALSVIAHAWRSYRSVTGVHKRSFVHGCR